MPPKTGSNQDRISEYQHAPNRRFAWYGSEQRLIEKSARRRWLYRLIGDLHFGRRWRNRVLLSALRDVSVPGRVLDAGCGLGQTMAVLQSRYPNAVIDGCDILEENVTASSSIAACLKLRSKQIWRCDIEVNAIPGLYDLIVCVDVIEHIVDWRSAVEHLSRSLAEGGSLLITTPTAGIWQTSAVGLRHFRRNKSGFDSRTGKGQFHAREGFVGKELLDGLTSSGLQIIWMRYAFGPIAMWWHTAFEIVRDYPMIFWGLVTLPAMIITPLIEPSLCDKGGSTVILARKPVGVG